MTTVTDLEYRKLLNDYRGTDVTKYNSTTVASSTFSKVNEITPSTDKVLYVYGVNFVPRADVTKIQLMIDGTTTNSYVTMKELFNDAPPGPALQPVVLFRPPLKASTGVYLKAKASTAQNNFRSVICAFEADE